MEVEKIKEEIKKEIEEESTYGFEENGSRMEPDSIPLAQVITENGQNVKKETDDATTSTSNNSDPDSLHTLKKEVADETPEGPDTNEEPPLSRADKKRLKKREKRKRKRARRATERAGQLNRESVDVRPPQAQPPNQLPQTDGPPAKRIRRPQNHEHNNRFRGYSQMDREEAFRANWQLPVNEDWGIPGHRNGGNWNQMGYANRPFQYPENSGEGWRGQVHWQQDWPMRRWGDGEALRDFMGDYGHHRGQAAPQDWPMSRWGAPRDFVGDHGYFREPARFSYQFSVSHEVQFAAATREGNGFDPGYQRVFRDENYQFPRGYQPPQFDQSPHYYQSAHYHQSAHYPQPPHYHRCNNCTCYHNCNCHHHGYRM